MKDHLKKSVEKYPLDIVQPISPISHKDGEIIVETIEAIKKLKRDDLASILKEWKYKKDEDIIDDLLEWNTNFKDTTGEPQTDVPFTKLESGNYIIYGKLYVKADEQKIIALGGVNYMLGYIFFYCKIQEWDYDNSCQKYGIKLNETADEDTFKKRYSDKKIFYKSKEERDKDYNKLDKAFKQQDQITLIEEENE